MEILNGFINEFTDASLYLIVANVYSHSGARGRHCLPVLWVYQNTLDKWPISAHPRLDRMNAAQLIPEYTITICPLSNQGSAARHLAVAFKKCVGFQTQISADHIDLAFGDIGATIPFAAIPATSACKQIPLCDGIKCHDVPPWLFLASPDPHISDPLPWVHRTQFASP